jgi:large subunit ribosomal protein L6
MSRIARKPLEIPTGVDFSQHEKSVKIKGSKGSFDFQVHESVNVTVDNRLVSVTPVKDHPMAPAMVGTTRILLENMVIGCSKGFEKSLRLVGVGYRAKAVGKILDLTLGFSHPVNFPIPEGITIETPTNTEILVKGIDKQLVGQVAANIRKFRKPEPYKGKGVRYTDEVIVIKETKKK